MAIYGAFDVKKGAVDVRTIHDSKRGAMVNWLWLQGVRVTNNWPDSEIIQNFKAVSNIVRLAELEIEVLRQVEPD